MEVLTIFQIANLHRMYGLEFVIEDGDITDVLVGGEENEK